MRHHIFIEATTSRELADVYLNSPIFNAVVNKHERLSETTYEKMLEDAVIRLHEENKSLKNAYAQALPSQQLG